MVLNYIWLGFFISALIAGVINLLNGDTEVFSRIMGSTFDMAKTGFEVSLGLTGVLALWLGIMKIGENGGMTRILSKIVGPLFRKIFPEIPRNHPAYGSIIMNIASNMLGLDNAATPLGLKAMKEMQEVNPNKEVASNAQIMFLVLNTSGLTIIPISIMVYRAQLGAANPADIFIPILLATYFSTLAGLISVAIFQRINLFNRVIMAYLLGLSLLVAGIIIYFSTLSQEKITLISNLSSNILLFGIIISFLLLAMRKRINVYDSFVEGAKEGFNVAIKIIPYLVAILVGIGVFRASGAMDFIISGIEKFFSLLNVDTSFIPALPTALMKPLSGSGARGLMIEAMTNYGPDSFVGRLASVFQGSTDTTFYVIALYFGSVGIKRTRYAITCGLIADFFGIIAAIFISYLFFGQQ